MSRQHITLTHNNGTSYDVDITGLAQSALDTIATYMRDDVREAIHSSLSPCTPAEFLIAYCKQDPELLDLLSQERGLIGRSANPDPAPATDDNTEGFTPEQLERLNSAAAKIAANTDLDRATIWDRLSNAWCEDDALNTVELLIQRVTLADQK